MHAVCFNSKYGFCKFGRKCDKIHVSDICKILRYYCNKCDKRHPSVCYYCRNDKMGKLSTFCSYKHEYPSDNSEERQVN